MTYATPADAMREYARNVGDMFADQQWILTDYVVWVRNPHYCGPEQPHPEDDMGAYFDELQEVQLPEAPLKRFGTLLDLDFDEIPF